MLTPTPSTLLASGPAPAPAASPGQETCWGTRLERRKCINTSPAPPTSLLKFEFHLLGIAGAVFCEALRKSELLLWSAEPSKELTLSEGEILYHLRLKMPILQKLL